MVNRVMISWEISKEVMTSRSKPRGLSREEEEELSRSKKKFKDIHNASFNDGSNESDHSQD